LRTGLLHLAPIATPFVEVYAVAVDHAWPRDVAAGDVLR